MPRAFAAICRKTTPLTVERALAALDASADGVAHVDRAPSSMRVSVGARRSDPAVGLQFTLWSVHRFSAPVQLGGMLPRSQSPAGGMPVGHEIPVPPMPQ